jgi:glycosyltransferase involved in cell wall biosynthesis
MKKLTIGLATYNGIETVGASIESLARQSFSDYDLVISDDASIDETLKIAKEYAKKDTRIKVICQPKNIGPLGNFKFLLSQAHTEYFMWASQDDLWSETFLELSISALNKDLSAAYTLPQWVCESWRMPFVRRFFLPKMNFLCLNDRYERLIGYTKLPFSSFKDNITYGVYRTKELQRCMLELDLKVKYFSIGCIHNEYIIQFLKAVSTPEAILRKRYKNLPPGHLFQKLLIPYSIFQKSKKLSSRYSTNDFFEDLEAVMQLSLAPKKIIEEVISLNKSRSEFY